jgi:hypothetical protein
MVRRWPWPGRSSTSGRTSATTPPSSRPSSRTRRSSRSSRSPRIASSSGATSRAGRRSTVHGQALGARAGSVRIHVDEANAGHSRIAQDGELEVVQAALDTFGLQDVTLVKIDVEGAELEVLEGAAVTIARWRPLVVIEDWTGPARAAAVLPGYRLAVDWGEAHQTYLFAP